MRVRKNWTVLHVKGDEGGIPMLWSATLECGIPVIDEQHKDLLRQADNLLDPSKKERVLEILRFLGQYVVTHFSTEQAMHSRSNYPKKDAHKQLHADFVRQYKELRTEYEQSGHNLDVLMKINNLVIGWLNDHIMMQDKEFAAYYKNQIAEG